MSRCEARGQGLSPLRLPELLGRRAGRAFARDDYFYASDLGEAGAVVRSYRFSRPWGVPVRYHERRGGSWRPLGRI